MFKVRASPHGELEYIQEYMQCTSFSELKSTSQDLKYEENSVKAVQCLNDMVTNALIHVEDCLQYMSALRDPAIFRFCAIPQVEDVL